MKDLRRKTRGEVLRHIGLQKDRTYCIFAMVSDKDKMATVAATSLTPQRAYKQLRDNAKTHQQGYRSMTATDEFLLNYTVDVRLLEQGVTAEDRKSTRLNSSHEWIS